MPRGRKPIDPALKLVKTGFTLPKPLVDDLDYLAVCTHSSRSAVLVAALERYLPDVLDSFKEAVYLAQQSPDRGLVLDSIASDFLIRVCQRQHGIEGVLYVVPPSEAPK